MATPFLLTVEDALALSKAISDKVAKPSSVVLPSTGQRLEIIVSGNGCRRVDVITNDARPQGWMKLGGAAASDGTRLAAAEAALASEREKSVGLEKERQRLQAVVSAPLIDQLRRLAAEHGVHEIGSQLESLESY